MQWTKYFRQKKNSVGIPKHSKREKTNGGYTRQMQKNN